MGAQLGNLSQYAVVLSSITSPMATTNSPARKDTIIGINSLMVSKTSLKRRMVNAKPNAYSRANEDQYPCLKQAHDFPLIS
jgi:hypothetical protein